MKLVSIIFLFIFTSCGIIKIPSMSENKEDDVVSLNGYKEWDDYDYIDHLESYKETYLEQYENDVQKLPEVNKKYLEGIVKKITEKNELFFKEHSKPEFYIINSKVPYHFSLPGKMFFFSTSLLEKYIKNESILYCLIAYELIRSEKNIYNKSFIIPTGSISTNKILSIMRIDTNDKVEIHKWAFYLLRRVGLEVDSYLSWLQIKNRNSLDFALQLGDIQGISREEAMFKAFLIKNTRVKNTFKKYEGSSKSFYKFINGIKR